MADESRWYVVHTYSGYENKVAQDLMTTAENRQMLDLICDAKVPTETAIEAIKAADSAVGADIAAAMPGVTLTGVTGSISFDEIGDANKDMAYIKQANTETGAFDFVKTQTVAELEG